MQFTAFQSDFLLMDGLETVTYTANPAGTALSVGSCLRGFIKQGAIALGTSIGLEPGDVPWLIPNVNLGTNKPRIGDFITVSASEIYTVIQVIGYNTVFGVYEVVARQQK